MGTTAHKDTSTATGPSLWMPWLRPVVLIPAACLLYFFIRYRSLAYLSVGSLVLAGYYLHYFLSSTPDRTERRLVRTFGIAGLVASAALVAVGLGLPALGTWQYLQMQDLGDMDQSAYVNALWNLGHGNLRFDIDGNNMFGIHSQYTAVLWIPLHWLGGPLGLKLGQALCLIAAALLMVRRHRAAYGTAAWGAVAILLCPPIASQFFFGFHPELLAAPALVLALEAYRQEKLGRFLACTAFLAYTKEPLTLAVGGILLLALLERRSWKWIILPGVLCCAQMAVYWWVVLPRFAPEGNHLSYFMPSTPGQVLSMWARPQNLFYVLHVTLPFLPLLLAMPKRYLVLPLPLMAFYAAFPDPLFVVMWPNYAFPVALLCAASLVMASGSVGSPSPATSMPLDRSILPACAVLALLCYPLWREPFSVPQGNLARSCSVNRLDALIPRDASVVVNGPFLTRFASRREYSMWGFRIRPLRHYDYAVIDTVLPFWQLSRSRRSASVDSLDRDAGWTRAYGNDGLFLFKRNRAADLADSSAASEGKRP